MTVDATMAKPRENLAAEPGQNSSTDDQSVMARPELDFERMTVGQLAAMLDEMQRLIVSIGSQLELRTQPAEVSGARDPGVSPTDDALTPAEIERLAAMLSVIERVRPV